VNPGETINYINDIAYAKTLSRLKSKLIKNLTKSGLTPLPTNRSIEELNLIEHGSTKKSDKKNEE